MEVRLRKALEPEPPLVASDTQLLLDAARHLCLGGGAKRARPRLVFAFGEVVGTKAEGLIDVAVAAELIHAASLLHDDVVDDGTVRRGRPTVNTVWGNTVAVLSGDLLLSIAFDHLKGLPPAILSDALSTVLDMTRAAIMEVCQRGRVDVPVSRWRTVAEGKTGALFGWCGRAAAHLAGDEDAVERFDRCGRHLGVAFQLADDLKDLLPNDSGKDRLADIRSRSPSYPILIAAYSKPELRDRLAAVWKRTKVDESSVRRVERLVLNTDALATTREAVSTELAEAISAIGDRGREEGIDQVIQWAEGLAEAADAEGFLCDRQATFRKAAVR